MGRRPRGRVVAVTSWRRGSGRYSPGEAGTGFARQVRAKAKATMDAAVKLAGEGSRRALRAQRDFARTEWIHSPAAKAVTRAAGRVAVVFAGVSWYESSVGYYYKEDMNVGAVGGALGGAYLGGERGELLVVLRPPAEWAWRRRS